MIDNFSLLLPLGRLLLAGGRFLSRDALDPYPPADAEASRDA